MTNINSKKNAAWTPARGKNLNIFLMDGTVEGRVKCTMANWTGVAYRIPRVDLDLCKDRTDLKQSGIYFLFGVSDETSKPTIYVGQAGSRKNGEGIFLRLKEHLRDKTKDYWTEAVVFTTSNDSLGSTDISYLENRFYKAADEVKRYDLVNGCEPFQGNFTEEKESELEAFFEYAKIVTGVLGHKVFESLDDEDEKVEDKRPIFLIKKSGANARAKLTPDGVVVLKGSILKREAAPSCPERIHRARENNKDYIDNNMSLTADLLFNSPSAASAFVLFSTSNGNKDLVTEDGVTLGDLERENS